MLVRISHVLRSVGDVTVLMRQFRPAVDRGYITTREYVS